VTPWRAMRRKGVRSFVNWRRDLRMQSRLKMAVVTGFVLALEAGLYASFLSGFRFFDSFEGLGALVINRLFSLFFLGMGLMLFFSSLATAYATFYRSRETEYLLTAPLSPAQIALLKFAEAATLSSWAFFFIVAPFAAAYAWHYGLGLGFAVWALCFSLPFVILCSGLGGLATMVWIRWAPNGRRFWRAMAALAVAGAVLLWRHSRGVYDPASDIQLNVTRIIPGLKAASNAWLPSYWFAEGVLSLARGASLRGAMLLAVLLSSAAAVCVAIEWLGGKIFYESWQRVQAGRLRGRRQAVMLGGIRALAGPLPRDVVAMVLKDVRTFLRDPMQWSQAIVFFGLLGLYFANLRSFRYDLREDYWRNMMGFLNVFSISAVTCSLSSRFIYPQLSLEGQGFWILGLAPTSMKRILITKFVFAAATLLVVCCGLAALSATMLNVSPAARRATVGIVAAIALAASAMSTGLGAVFLDLRQRNPSAIVSGFGGTLNLVASLAFMVASIAPFAVLFHLQFAMRMEAETFRRGLIFATLWLTACTAACVAAPLLWGLRSLERRDY
jgi:ABC-2 type transport system permease protein